MGQEATYYNCGVIIVSEDFVKEVLGEDINDKFLICNRKFTN